MCFFYTIQTPQELTFKFPPREHSKFSASYFQEGESGIYVFFDHDSMQGVIYLCKQPTKIYIYVYIYFIYIYVYPYDICLFKHAQWQCVILLYQPPSYFWNQLPSNKEFEPREKKKSMSLQLAIFFQIWLVREFSWNNTWWGICLQPFLKQLLTSRNSK